MSQIDKIIEKAKSDWNAHADKFNQWDVLGADEKLELVASAALAAQAAHPAPALQPMTKSVNEFATQLKCAGWKDTGDAQWDGLAKLMKELGVTHDQNNRP